jgi:small subunit ribosomal protein S6
MSFYENTFIARQDLTPAQVDEMVEKYADIITQNGGKVTKRENWGLRVLAYKIQKNRKGYYMFMNIDAPASAVKEMERQMRIDENVLRYLTVRVDELEEGPSSMLAPKGRRAQKFDSIEEPMAEEF